ncbi:ubiquinone biosynthesis protein COQ9, mitochondrial isoform X2 [Leptinotarsa decemlineata]|uniref:ubiquinone biosynthesis protein COQ9, mitochondrial isoform X2 n=1 Tax=Leptinotarsa decemlineata TaxID=7539 RepID=UPI000C2527DD|nr:ubiquinone biosynthesis protein COQ9, mitochondrial-like isoform X2 [Leptinotarsa decemlineata]
MVLIAFAASIMLRRFNLRSTSKLIVWQVTRLSSTDSSSTKECNGPTYEDEIRNKILAASLPFVPELGWSKEAISNGAECIGYPGISHGMFTRGGADLVHYFQTSSNSKLVDILKKIQEECKENPILPGEFAEKAIQARLKMIQPYISKWPQAIAIMSMPPNVPNSLATLLTMVDDICYYAGDRSVDFNWYLRRIGIAGVYKATELYMIQDKSDEFLNTWTFLNRRLGEAVQLHDLLCKSEVTSQSAKETVQSVFITARNILGLNWNR